LTILRHASSAINATVVSRDINKNLSLFQCNTHGKELRPLVLLFGWLHAKPHHIKKFTEFYLDQGFDVLSIQVSVAVSRI